VKTPLVGPDSLEIDAVVPQCLDNQYVSDRVFSEMLRRGVDFGDPRIAELREHDFRTEFIRSLLYSSQVVIQRAFFRNSDFLYKNYLPESPDNLTAFAQLIREKAVIPFLLKETSLRDDLEFDLSRAGDRATKLLLGEIDAAVTCVRLAVDEADNDRAAASLATEFGSRLTRLEHLNDEQRNAMASELFADPRRLQQDGVWRAFDEAIDNLVDFTNREARRLRRTSNRQLTRQDVYQGNFVVDSTGQENVVQGRFRRPGKENPFLLELKKYVDLVYNVNLPDHLKRYTFTPANMPTRTAMQDTPGIGYPHEQVSDLVSNGDALEAIRRNFMAYRQNAMNLPLLRDLTIADVLEIRALPEWESFKDSQANILRFPLQCLDRIEEFQHNFDTFQRAMSRWYNAKYARRVTEERYCSYVSLALSIAGKLIVAGTDLGSQEKVISMFVSDRLVSHIPKKVKGYAAKLMVGVYDIGERRLDADRTYTIELMQTSAELLREDVIALLDSVNRRVDDGLPGATEQVADQGIQ
jgi:hypothetical protein